MIRNFFIYREPREKYNFEITSDKNKSLNNIQPMENVSSDIKANLNYVKDVFSYGKNGDIVIREFDVSVDGKLLGGFVVSADGLANSGDINRNILMPLMCLSDLEKRHGESTEDYIYRRLIHHCQISKQTKTEELLKTINYGNSAVFIDTLEVGFLADVKGWEHRGVAEPVNETVIQGPHEGFNEMFRANTGLIRKTLNTSNLIMEDIKLGKTSQTAAAVCYLKNVTNASIVDEVRYRLQNIDAEYILTSLNLAQYIEEATFLSIPQVVATERPDRVCNALIEGRVAVVVGGSPQVLIVPTTIFDLTTSPEDSYLRFPYALLVKIIRMAAIILSVLAPAVFLAVVNFHQELLLTDILFALSKARASVPFSSLMELLLMELSFELIKEAGIRVPGPVGSTLGIVGGLILGQAAVSANIVSPITIIIVAITGIASFAIPSYQLSFSFRFMRFIYTFSAAFAGFFGILTVMFVDTLLIVNTKSFGTPYASPVAPRDRGKLIDTFFTEPIWKKGKRPEYLEPKDKEDSAKISRKWKYRKR